MFVMVFWGNAAAHASAEAGRAAVWGSSVLPPRHSNEHWTFFKLWPDLVIAQKTRRVHVCLPLCEPHSIPVRNFKVLVEVSTLEPDSLGLSLPLPLTAWAGHGPYPLC